MAKSFAIITLLLLAATHPTWQLSLPSDLTYHAGIVEFAPIEHEPLSARRNMLNMKKIIESDETKDLDILVFPEYVLNDMDLKTYVPDPEEHIAPCDTPNYEHFLVELSCSARSRQLYVVLNMVEKVPCLPGADKDCHSSGHKTYNTNVVFDRQGVVISRYRKTHLYRGEWYSTNILAQPDHAIFKTDFGVTFGHFICFDMLFYDPARVLVKEYNVTDIIYPTYWFSELPFLTAVQLQEGWAYANDVNLLAADASNPSNQNTGSGIYAGKLGRLTAMISEVPTTRLLKARVPKHNQGTKYQLPAVVQPAFVAQLETPRFTKMALLRDYNVDIFATKLLAEDFTAASETVCHSSFCCKFNVSRTLISNSAAHAAYRYRLGAYSGNKVTFQRIDPSDLSICAIIACTNDELWSCGHIFPAGRLVGNKYYFNAINISGSFRHADRRLIMPSSVDAVMMPLPVAMYEMKQMERSNSTYVEIALTSPKADLLTFGIWANYYSQRLATHNLYAATPMSGHVNSSHVGSSTASVGVSWPVAALLLVTTLVRFI